VLEPEERQDGRAGRPKLAFTLDCTMLPAISVQFETVIDRPAPGNSSFYPLIESALQPTEELQIAAGSA